MKAPRILLAEAGVSGLSKSEIDSFLASQKTPLRLGTRDNNGNPFIHPVWFLYSKKKLYIFTLKDSRKARNIRRNKLVYFSVDTDSEPNKGVRGRASACFITEPSRAMKLTEMIVTKYLGDSKSGLGKTLMDGMRKGSSTLIEITPRYYSVWNYQGLHPDA